MPLMTSLRPLFWLALCLLMWPLAGCDSETTKTKTSWTTVIEELDEALLSIWGTAADDIWVVGADTGAGPAVLHYDGADWTRHPTGATGGLWWVAGLGETLWMVGEGGLILRHRRGTDTFEQMPGPPAATLFGVIAFADDDVWAVGGEAVANRGVVWHYDGTSWSAVADVPEAALAEGQLFKVWGTSSDDLWIVGLGGVAMHRSATGWQVMDVPSGRGLFTLHGDGDTIAAVGGFQSGLLIEVTDGEMSDRTPAGAPQLNGVFVRPGGDAVAVGIGGAVWRRVAGQWTRDEEAPRSRLDLHAVYIDPDGGIWAVGGFVVSDPLDRGLLVYYGSSIPATLENP
jgi:hypothetical protein